MFYPNNRNYRGNRFRKGFFFLLAMAGGALLLGAAVMFLWNAILPDVLGIARLNYWQALGLLVLCRLLFGGRGGGRFYGPGHHRPGGKPHWREKWMSMSEEEKQHFKEAWKERCRKKESGQ